MIKYLKWIFLGGLVSLLVYHMPPINSGIDKHFEADSFRRYDLLVSDSVTNQMAVLAKPVHHDYSKSKVWFKAQLISVGDTIQAKIRLKGDKEDHYNSDLLSWRLKYKVNQEKHVVSLQHPKTRKYISEWMFHKLLKQEGILYLGYEFAAVYVNNKFKGLYAEEEHFSNHDIEKKWGRVRGPILGFDDNGYWPQGMWESSAEFDSTEYYKSAIRGYNTNKKDGQLALYTKAAKLLADYREGKLPVNKIFDVRSMAQYYALTDLTGGHHGLRWINCRYYFNPQTNLLEPVGFDSDGTPINQLAIHESRLNPAHHNKLISDPEFLDHYYSFLSRYVKKGFLADFFKENDEELKLILAALNDQFDTDKSGSKNDLYLNQWVIFYHLNKTIIYLVGLSIVVLLVLIRIKKRKKSDGVIKQ